MLSSRVSVLSFRVSVSCYYNHNSYPAITTHHNSYPQPPVTFTCCRYIAYAMQQCNSKVAAHGISTAPTIPEKTLEGSHCKPYLLTAGGEILLLVAWRNVFVYISVFAISSNRQGNWGLCVWIPSIVIAQ